MIAYFTSVFKVMKETIHDGETLLGQGVTPEQLARATAIDCFKQADVNGDGRVSLDEFRVWYSLPAVAAVAPSAPPPSLAPGRCLSQRATLHRRGQRARCCSAPVRPRSQTRGGLWWTLVLLLAVSPAVSVSSSAPACLAWEVRLS
jgi:hypothetical protein